jgi:hypothetical protein
MWLPAGTGMWPAFWSDGQNWPYDGEIDAIEGMAPTVPRFTTAISVESMVAPRPCEARRRAGTRTPRLGPVPNQWYYDGWQVGRPRTKIDAPMYLIVNLGTRAYLSAVPNRLRVDSVRVWQ